MRVVIMEIVKSECGVNKTSRGSMRGYINIWVVVCGVNENSGGSMWCIEKM